MSEVCESVLHVRGSPNERQKLFFASRARYTAYGGARGGGKSWALRRKLVGLCLCYPGIRCLLVRRSYAELKANHVRPLLDEYGTLLSYSEGDKVLSLPNGSTISLGYCSSTRDVLRYQGQEYDIIAIDEATQLSEYQFSIFKACLRGTGAVPRRMYLTCNPGGVGHAWVKRLFVERNFRQDEDPNDYLFISAQVYDNPVLLRADPDYVRQLESLPQKLRDAWLYGRWDVFEGQFFSEFDPDVHICSPAKIPLELHYFVAIDYGFDMLAALLMGVDIQGNLYVIEEYCQANLTLSEAAHQVANLCRGRQVRYAVASPDLWNRRQDTGKSGFEVMQSVPGMPPMCAADNRRVPGWRLLREYLQPRDGDIDRAQSSPKLMEAAMKNAANALANDADRYIYGLYAQAGSSIQCDATTVDNIVNLIIDARTKLFTNNVSDPGDIVIEVTPEIAGMILKAKVNLSTNNTDVMETGCIGAIGGCKIFVSNNVEKVDVTGGSAHKCLARTKRAIAFAEQLSEIDAYRPELRFADAVKGLHLYGAKVVYPKEMVLLDLKVTQN